jgi:hypothetical protein
MNSIDEMNSGSVNKGSPGGRERDSRQSPPGGMRDNRYVFYTLNALHTYAHSTLHTTHYTLHTTHYTLRTTHYALHTTQYTLRTTHYTLHTTHYTLRTLSYTHYTHNGNNRDNRDKAPAVNIRDPELLRSTFKKNIVGDLFGTHTHSMDGMMYRYVLGG